MLADVIVTDPDAWFLFAVAALGVILSVAVAWRGIRVRVKFEHDDDDESPSCICNETRRAPRPYGPRDE